MRNFKTTEYATPTGLWSLWNFVLQICRAYGAEEKCVAAGIVSGKIGQVNLWPMPGTNRLSFPSKE